MNTEELRELFNVFKGKHRSTRDRNNKILVIDGLNMFIRSFSGSPAMDTRGNHVGGLLGFMKSLFAVIKMFRPTRCVIVFDGIDGGRGRRMKFPEYKAGRKNRTRLNRFIDVTGILDEGEEFKRQLKRLEQYLNVLPVQLICINYIEADDVIGYITKGYYSHINFDEITIVSSDKDFLQLIDEKTKIYRPTERKLYDTKQLKERFSISPKNYLTFRTLDGDAADNIPGVPGVGLKTMLKCFPEFKDRDISTEDIILSAEQKIKDGSKLKTYKNIAESSDRISLNWELMQLHDVDISGSKKLTIKKILDSKVYRMDKKVFKEMLYNDNLHSHIQYIDQWIYSTLR